MLLYIAHVSRFFFQIVALPANEFHRLLLCFTLAKRVSAKVRMIKRRNTIITQRTFVEYRVTAYFIKPSGMLTA